MGYKLYEVMNTVEELLTCDGLFNALVIYNDDLAHDLEESGYAFKTTRGSYRYTDLTKEFLDFLYALADLGVV